MIVSSDPLKTAVSRLQFLCAFVPPKLDELGEAVLSEVPRAGAWSKKQIIGHLIDSAANNHHRFVRAQFEDVPIIAYRQNDWNEHGRYAQMQSAEIIAFWTAYNRFLAEMIATFPAENFAKTVDTGNGNLVRLDDLFFDYIAHLEHHLHQLIVY